MSILQRRTERSAETSERFQSERSHFDRDQSQSSRPVAQHKEKKGLGFTVLSDADRKLTKSLGILVTQPESMRSVFEFAQIDWKKRYGTDSLDVPVPATFLVDQKGV